MPPSARKSSVGAARRAVQKSHVPYRGNDPTVGRKTGLHVRSVPRGSDGFEPFDQVLEQGAREIPVRARKKKSVPQDDEDEDEDEDEDDQDGEMSMDVDSPVQNYSNTRPPTTPRTPRRISNTSEVDFDQVPSPRPHRSAGRTAGPSRLAQSAPLTAQELLDQEEEDGYGGGGGFDDYAPQESPRQLSFTEMDKDDEEMEEEEEDPPIVSPTRGKGKGKALEPLQEDDMEDDIARGMDDADMAPPESDEGPPSDPPPKKQPVAKEKPKPAKRQKENRDVPEGVRRSKRVPYKPLDWWRLEKVVFGRNPSDGPILVPQIKEIIRIPKEPVVPLGKKSRSRRRSRSTPVPNGRVVEKIVEKIVEVPVDNANPEEGWDDETETQAVVKTYRTGEDVTRRIAFTAKMVNPQPAANSEWFFQKIFGDGDFMAAGQVVIPPKGRKPSKPTKDNTFIFFVIEGAVNLKVCDTSVIVASGGMFMIPRGNTYFIENIADRDAKLFFTQARKMREAEVDPEDDERRVSSSSVPPARAVSVAINGNARTQDLRRGMSSNV
ncbi:Mif2/CENP-C like-domain-containing protein [Mycena maculata]|uniref:CENP-C homolog n=1 Tax=Mycena maculata TaxID=230809 RepID=A0AAD7JTY7_9AGAR|nr:Mif2/CENP-C like-domain-containing protein [Mycena maculata]